MERDNLLKFFTDIIHLDYVIQRNWEKDPYEEGDLDLFVSNEDFNQLELIVQGYDFPFKVDIRTPGDGYYTEKIEKLLLKDPIVSIYKTPNDFSAFIALMYHSLVHKFNNPYKEELEDMFYEIFPPVKPQDPGVGFFYDPERNRL